MEKLGARIRFLRKAKHLTIVNVAKSTGIDQATLSRIENGKMTGTLDSHKKIANALGCTLSDLHEESTDSQNDRVLIQKLETIVGEITHIIRGLDKKTKNN